MEEVVVFGKEPDNQLSSARRIAARGYVERALADASRLAIDFQRTLLEDEEADPALRFKASEAVLDRFMGKAAQELRVEDNTARPLVFDAKLAALKEGMKAAVDAVVRDRAASAEEVFGRAVTEHLYDHEGVSI